MKIDRVLTLDERGFGNMRRKEFHRFLEEVWLQRLFQSAYFSGAPIRRTRPRRAAGVRKCR